jgi:surface antigen
VLSIELRSRRAFHALEFTTLKRVAFVLTGVLGASVVASQVVAVPAAQAAAFTYAPGYSVQQGWLCYGWSNGALHCTQYWYRDGAGHAISENPGWVPNAGYSTYSGTSTGTSSSSTPAYSGPSQYSTWTSSSSDAAPTGIGQWTYTGHAAYAMSDFAGDPYSGSFGSCTWYAWYRQQGEPLMQLGNAADWAYNAAAHGLTTGSQPEVGATAVFQGGVQGASSLGHAAHVEAVYSGGWFLVSEMAFTWNGGGWGRVSYRYAHTGAGVSFIY